MKPARGIGYWRNDQHPELPDPHDYIDTSWDDDTRFRVAFYLRQGMYSHAYMGYSTYRICGKTDDGDLELTDGTYIWPSGLEHYVREHSVRLPDEFVAHLEQVEEANEEFQADLDWWLQQRPGA